MENISQTAKVLKRKAEVLPDLEESYREAHARYSEAEKARDQRHKADELKKEIAWGHVAVKEQVSIPTLHVTMSGPHYLQELKKRMTDVETIKHRIEKHETAVKEAEVCLQHMIREHI